MNAQWPMAICLSRGTVLKCIFFLFRGTNPIENNLYWRTFENRPWLLFENCKSRTLWKVSVFLKIFLFSSLEKNKGIQMVSYCSLATSSLAPPIVPTLLWRWPQPAKHVQKWLDQLINSKAPTIVDKISTGRAFTDRIQPLCCLWVSRPCQPLRPSCYEQVRLKGTNLRWFSRKKTGPQRQSWPEIWIDMWYVKQGQWFGNLLDISFAVK